MLAHIRWIKMHGETVKFNVGVQNDKTQCSGWPKRQLGSQEYIGVQPGGIKIYL
jgi:hypothetical protein